MSSTEETDMARIIKQLVDRLHYLSILKNEKDFGFSNASILYETVYEFGRRTHLQPDYRKLLTNEDEKNLKEFFPIGFTKLIGYTPGLVNNIDPSDLNIARGKRSQIWFLKNEFLDFYKEVSGYELTQEMKDALKKLEQSDDELEFNISNWTRPDYDEAVDRPSDVPNLNGVPESHDWWTEEHRQLWKNKKE
ncbi:hypothetical protein I4U23_015472 [Adineta vaga]|nr:hypothetical protein I4U23_015472 [Adineta vaga]